MARSLGIYFLNRTQMTYNKSTKPMKQYQADFSLNRKQRSLLVYVICVQYTKFWPEFGSSYLDKLSIHLIMEGVHLTVSLGMLKTMLCLNELMHVENWESDHLQHDLYVDISYEFTLAWVFVSHACTQITLMNTCMSDLDQFLVIQW